MSWVILVDDRAVETAETEDMARKAAEHVQDNIARYVNDEFGGAFSVVGSAPANDRAAVSYLKPSDSVPDALVPDEFKQFR